MGTRWRPRWPESPRCGSSGGGSPSRPCARPSTSGPRLRRNRIPDRGIRASRRRARPGFGTRHRAAHLYFIVASEIAGIVVRQELEDVPRRIQPSPADEFLEELRVVDDLVRASELRVFVLDGVEA